jgi:hypothetical protein
MKISVGRTSNEPEEVEQHDWWHDPHIEFANNASFGSVVDHVGDGEVDAMSINLGRIKWAAFLTLAVDFFFCETVHNGY